MGDPKLFRFDGGKADETGRVDELAQTRVDHAGEISGG